MAAVLEIGDRDGAIGVGEPGLDRVIDGDEGAADGGRVAGFPEAEDDGARVLPLERGREGRGGEERPGGGGQGEEQSTGHGVVRTRKREHRREERGRGPAVV